MYEMYEFTTDTRRLSLEAVHDFLSTSYWAKGVDVATVKRSMAGSLCFGFLENARTVAFARVITDQATFAYLADVFVLAEHRGRGLGKELLRRILEDERLETVRRWVLRTEDAHGLYRRYGFSELTAAATWMVRPGNSPPTRS